MNAKQRRSFRRQWRQVFVEGTRVLVHRSWWPKPRLMTVASTNFRWWDSQLRHTVECIHLEPVGDPVQKRYARREYLVSLHEIIKIEP